MRIILACFLSLIVTFNFRLAIVVLGTEPNQPSTNLNQNEALLNDVTNLKDSTLSLSNLDVNTNFFEETDKQELLFPSQSIADTPFLESIEVSSDIGTTAETVVFPSVDTATELKSRGKTQLQNEKSNSSNQIFSSFESEKKEYVVHAEPKVQVEAITEETVEKEVNKSETVSPSSQEELKKTAPQHEDIPSFSEWTQKQLAEAEKKKTDQNETTDRFSKTRGKFRNKNYASPDCGAKIVAANSESLSSSAVLSPLKDEYMLNYCTNRIWFVIELCEAIQAKQLDLANFELFSSSPKHFSVFVSHRFPTRDWSNVGKFTAQDSRDVQTFNLNPHLFGKYVKVELHSHYGREQFCPISWVGIYGTSEYEVLAKEDERHLLSEDDEADQYEEDIYVGHRKDSPKNLFSSATDAVLSIVKKATAPFMNTENNETESQRPAKSTDSENVRCVSPRYITVCNNCSQSFYDEVFKLLSCKHSSLAQLISNPFVKRTLIHTESCTKFGLDFSNLKTGAPFPFNFLRQPGKEVNYLTAMLKNSVVAALCNVLAVSENRVVVNVTAENDQTLKNITEKKELCNELNPSKPQPPSLVSPSSECKSDCSQSSSSSPFHYTKSSIFTEIFKPSEQFSEKIEPTKTLTEDEVKRLPPSIVNSENLSKIKEEKSTVLPSSGHVMPTATATLGTSKIDTESSTRRETKVSFVESKTEPEKEVVTEEKSNNATNQYSTLDSIISDINAIEKGGSTPSSSNTPAPSNLPAESIFLRLANRIKTLEINMSLSSTYLEELSKRYRTQLELLSKTLNLTIQKLEERSKIEDEKERRKEKEILMLRMQLANLTRDVSILVREKNSWRPRASSISQHIFFISIELLFVWAVFSYWNRSGESKKNSPERFEPVKKLTRKFKRRNSLEGVKGHETPRRKTRRPSDEALEIALARTHAAEILKFDKKRKRRKKDSKCSINAIHMKRKRSDSTVPEVAADTPAISSASEEAAKPSVIPSNVMSLVDVEVSNRFAPFASPSPPPEGIPSAPKAIQSLSSSPIFIKTALATRHSRLKSVSDQESSQESGLSIKVEQESTKKDRKGSNSFKKYMKKFF